jgi:hypothetical protein
MNWKGYERKQSWPKLKYSSGILWRNFGIHDEPQSEYLVSCPRSETGHLLKVISPDFFTQSLRLKTEHTNISTLFNSSL